MNWIELLGTTASVVVALSLTIKNMKGLRLVNTLGALAFALYGFLIQAWPVLGLNAFIVVINLYYLGRMAGEVSHFQILPMDQAPGLLREFERFYRQDILHFQPEFRLPESLDSVKGAFILREAVPISLMIFRSSPEGDWEVLLDYAVPSFRDYKNAQFFFSKGYKHLFDREHLTFFVRSGVKEHKKYLRRLGFKAVGSEEGEALFTLQP